jgi:cytidylate kinase
MTPPLDLRTLVVDLTRAECRFVVIGSSALALQGWKVSPTDLDLMAPVAEVDAIAAALGASQSKSSWVEEGEARRLELQTERGLVDIYVSVSGGLTFEDVTEDAIPILFTGPDVNVLVGSLQHVRDMRAAVGRSETPQDAIAPAARGDTPNVIAIDGPAGAGKSTVAHEVAKRLDLVYLNTGAMYRCVALAVLQRQADTDDVEAITMIANTIKIGFREGAVYLDGTDVTAEVRQEQVTEASSHIAAYPEVRSAMVAQQRRLFESGGYVIEGRDTGTVVAPDAPLKIYLTASLEERARRRAAEEKGEAPNAAVPQMMEALADRDDLDSQREFGALRVADDAVVVDTTHRSIRDVVDEIAALAHEREIV